MRPGRDRIEKLLALDRVGVAAALERELLVVDAARDIRRQHDRGVDRDRRPRGARPARLRRQDRDNDRGAERQADPPSAHPSLLRPAPFEHTRARRPPEGRARSL